jgi:Zn-dependent protease
VVPTTLATAGALPLLALGQFDLGRAIIYVICLILCVAVHEFGHAYVADRLGDPLPRQQGRVTLNPLAHIDLVGTVLLPTLMALGVGIPLGWGKPVEWTGHPRYLTRRFHMRTIRLMVSVAGPAMNLILALLVSVVLVVGVRLRLGGDVFFLVCQYLVRLNLGLMFFNLLPVPPLDGRSFLEYLPSGLAGLRDFLMRYGAFVFLALVLLPTMGNGMSPLGYIMLPFTWLTGKYLQFLVWLAL